MKHDATETIQSRYDRIAPFFDWMETPIEKLFFRRWRAMLWEKVEPGNILEVGVGTGKNFPYYPAGAWVTAVDFSAGMLARAAKNAERQGIRMDLRQMDIERLEFPGESFDTVVATFVFCSVPDPVRGLMEIGRVLKPNGKILLLEHVLSENPLAARLMNLLNPLIVRLVGANINRRTVENVRRSGLILHQVGDLTPLVKLIEAGKPPAL